MSFKDQLSDAYSSKKVLVTGHTGFKGSWLCMVLRNLGAQVTGLSLAPETQYDHYLVANCEADMSESIIGDITTPNMVSDIMKRMKPDIVFHLAAQPLVRRSYANPYETYNTNVMGSLNVLEAVRNVESIKALVYVTSDKCYRNNEWIWGYRESDELGGHDPYSASKALAELMFASHWKSFFADRDQFGAATVRAGNVIGGGDFAADRIVPDCIRAAVRGEPIRLRNPHATRPWQHVLDPIAGYLLTGAKLIKDPKGYSGSWNFGPDAKSIKTVFELTESLSKYWPGFRIVDESNGAHPHEAGLLHLNCDKAHHRLGWYPIWSFDETIQHTSQWYSAWHNKENLRKFSLKQIDLFMERM